MRCGWHPFDLRRAARVTDPLVLGRLLRSFARVLIRTELMSLGRLPILLHTKLQGRASWMLSQECVAVLVK